MDNHFHLLVETPEPNLGRGLQWLNTSDCVWFNRRHQRPAISCKAVLNPWSSIRLGAGVSPHY